MIGIFCTLDLTKVFDMFFNGHFKLREGGDRHWNGNHFDTQNYIATLSYRFTQTLGTFINF